MVEVELYGHNEAKIFLLFFTLGASFLARVFSTVKLNILRNARYRFVN